MARLYSTGLETNPTAASHEGMEFLTASKIVTSPVRSGAYAFNANADANNFRFQYRAADTQESCFYRAYFMVSDLPNQMQQILSVRKTGGGLLQLVKIQINTTGTLELWNHEDNVQIGSDSAALSLDQWYRIEIALDTTTLASSVVSARIDGVEFASGTINLANAACALSCDAVNGGSSFSFYYDDVAINDSSGSFQNSWPGAGSIIHLHPNAVGDNSDWTANGGGDDYLEVDEITPDDATTHIRDTVLNEIDDFNLEATPAELDAGATINCVQVGVRFAESASTESTKAFVLRIKSDTAGTVEESAPIDPESTSYVTNAPAIPRTYALTLYDLPGASTDPWTKALLDTAQIGVRISTAGSTENIRVSKEWLLVDYTPSAPATALKDIINMNGILAAPR